MVNKRPICLLDVIYKIIAKVLVNRINKVIKKIVHGDQTGFIKGRYIGENTRLISDVIQYCETDNIDGILLAVDYRNAFDSVEHEFIWYTLESFNFGPELIAWIKVLYNGALLAICNNGYTSEWFECERGTFQGSPLSGLLFILVGEMFANRLRRDNSIQGITIHGIEVKVSMYADDTTMFLNNEQSTFQALKVLEEFRTASGLELNKNKTKLMRLGSVRNNLENLGGIQAVSKIKILGIYHSATKDCGEDNIAPVIQKIRNVTNSWCQRQLTIKGRITVARAMLISQLVYVASSVNIPNVDLQTIQSLIMKFIWRGRPPKVAQGTLCLGIKEGGLKAPDVFKCYESLRLQWVKRIYINVDSQWRKLLQARFGYYQINDFLRNRSAILFLRKLDVPKFYKYVFDRYQSLFVDDVNTAQQARAESIWHNVKIKVGGKPIFNKHLYNAGIKIIDDLVDRDGSLMSLARLNEKYPQVRLDFLRLQSIKNAIPSAWKNLIRQGPREILSSEDKRCCLINVKQNGTICLRALRSSHVYTTLLVMRTPTAQRKWEEEGFTFDNWEHLYEIPYKCSSSTKLQSLQYRVLHRYIPTRKYLCTRSIVGSRLCRNCFEVDNLQHFFYLCADVKGIWDFVLPRLKDRFRLPNAFVSIETIIFGRVKVPAVVNLIIILCKQHITLCKLREDASIRPSIGGVLHAITNQHSVEEIIAKRSNSLDKFWNKWEKVINKNGDNIFK